MKEYITVLGMFIGFSLLMMSQFILSVTLINDWLVYSSVVGIGLLIATFYIFKFRTLSLPNTEYFFIALRSTLIAGSIIVFLLLWINFYWKSTDTETIETPVIASFLNKTIVGNKFSKRVKLRTAFVIDYKGQTKNIIWDTRLDDETLHNIEALLIKKNEGFFGIDIIEEQELLYSKASLGY
jgi:hypothetical protein